MPILFNSKKLETKPQPGCKIRVISDYPTAQDTQAGYLFSDNEGQIFRSWVKAAGATSIEADLVCLWKQADTRDSFESRLVTKDNPHAAQSAGLFATGKYLTHAMLSEAEEKLAACREAPANITIVLGDTAAKIVSGQRDFKLGKNRGTVNTLRGSKLLYTLHPRHVRTQWKDYPVALMDIIKAVGASTSAEYNPPDGKILIAEKIRDVLEIINTLEKLTEFSVDIETTWTGTRVQIDTIGFAAGNTSWVIPIFNRFKLGTRDHNRKKYIGEWSAADEIFIMLYIKDLLAGKSVKILQNGIYDSWILWRCYGIPMAGGWQDTMIQHHCLHVELRKGLDVLGSLYTDYPAWKQMRQFGSKKKGE